MVEASDEIRGVISSVRYKLPTEMREPVLQRFNPSAQPIMNMALSSTGQNHAQISRMAEDQLSDRLRSVPGVATVIINGSLKRELSVLLRAEKMREFNVSASDVVNALRAPKHQRAGRQGQRQTGRRKHPPGRPHRDAGRIPERGRQTDERPGRAPGPGRHHRRRLCPTSAASAVRSGKANVGIQVTRARDASTVSVADDIRKMVEEINKDLDKDGQGTKLEITRDGGKDAQRSLNNVIESLVLGAVLTIFVVYAFLNSWRSTLITALSLPTSVIAAFIAVWLCGFTLNFMTLLGLSLAIGVLIDDAIVVRENIVRHMQRGSDRRTAALEGTGRNRPGRGRHHVLHHRRVHSGSLHARRVGRMVPSICADGNLLGDCQPGDFVHARSDAVGLLG